MGSMDSERNVKLIQSATQLMNDKTYISLYVPSYENALSQRFFNCLSTLPNPQFRQSAYLTIDDAKRLVANDHYVKRYVKVNIPIESVDLKMLEKEGYTFLNRINAAYLSDMPDKTAARVI